MFKGTAGEPPKDNKFYRKLYPTIIKDIEVSMSYLFADVIKISYVQFSSHDHSWGIPNETYN